MWAVQDRPTRAPQKGPWDLLTTLGLLHHDTSTSEYAVHERLENIDGKSHGRTSCDKW